VPPKPSTRVDLTVAAIPFYLGSMAAEAVALRRRSARYGPSAGDYEWRDTVTSLSMGLGSLVAPLVMPRLLAPVTPGKGRWGRVLVAGAVGAAAVATIADVVARRSDATDETGNAAGQSASPGAAVRAPVATGREQARPATRRAVRVARRVASSAAATAVAGGVTAAATTWAARTGAAAVWSGRRRRGRDLGTGVAATAAAVLAWDFLYYWNHRFMHESRWMWAVHAVHHSSERYNLSTALRQPVADAVGMGLPYGALCLAGMRPEVIETARGVNLLYQFWIHTETIGKLGRVEEVLNTPSHHRVHHGSNQRYLDRNHGSILIVWDRLFGTFTREDEPVVYGLTTNIDTFNPARVAAHEHAAILRDVARATTWRDRLGHVVRGPGWTPDRPAKPDLAAAG
jgi:sterol desaturase/sphingolipid hydroxylase (fatty acid hydroxylase superfamily)